MCVFAGAGGAGPEVPSAVKPGGRRGAHVGGDQAARRAHTRASATRIQKLGGAGLACVRGWLGMGWADSMWKLKTSKIIKKKLNSNVAPCATHGSFDALSGAGTTLAVNIRNIWTLTLNYNVAYIFRTAYRSRVVSGDLMFDTDEWTFHE